MFSCHGAFTYTLGAAGGKLGKKAIKSRYLQNRHKLVTRDSSDQRSLLAHLNCARIRKMSDNKAQKFGPGSEKETNIAYGKRRNADG
jgi:hypothetical protein